jgi:hypothetical protein
MAERQRWAEDEARRRRESEAGRSRGTDSVLSPYGATSSGSSDTNNRLGSSVSSSSTGRPTPHHHRPAQPQIRSQPRPPLPVFPNSSGSYNSFFNHSPSTSSFTFTMGTHPTVSHGSHYIVPNPEDALGRSRHNVSASSQPGPSRGVFADHQTSISFPPPPRFYGQDFAPVAQVRVTGGGHSGFRVPSGHESSMSALPNSTVTQNFAGSGIRHGSNSTGNTPRSQSRSGFGTRSVGNSTPHGQHPDQRDRDASFGGNGQSDRGAGNNIRLGDDQDEDGDWEDWPEAYEIQPRPNASAPVAGERTQRPPLHRSSTTNHPSPFYSPEALLENPACKCPFTPANFATSSSSPHKLLLSPIHPQLALYLTSTIKSYFLS